MLESKIKSHYETHSCKRITQGDLLRDVSFIISEGEELKKLLYQYGIVLSQDCDLEQGSKITINSQENGASITEFNQFLPSILFLPAFPAETLREGEHLVDMYQVKSQRLNGNLWKPIVSNNNPRYHFLPAEIELQIPELVLDFKTYYTIPFKTIANMHKDHYLATVNEIFREGLSQRFANYISRIGLPELISA